MCGIFGIVSRVQFTDSGNLLLGVTNKLFKLSESRGKEAAGLSIRDKSTIYVLKEPLRASKFIASRGYREVFQKISVSNKDTAENDTHPILIIGHSRLVTHGQSGLNNNNQPVIKRGVVGVHNGVIVNDTVLWDNFPEMQREYQVDTEVILSLVNYYRGQGNSLVRTIQKTYAQIEGTASIALQFDDTDILLLATNTGSLYICEDLKRDMLIFASERKILKQLLNSRLLKKRFDSSAITQVKPYTGLIVELNSLNRNSFSLNMDETTPEENYTSLSEKTDIRRCFNLTEPVATPNRSKYIISDETKKIMNATWEYLYKDPDTIKRCKRCLLPHTMPYITFDKGGVCNYCRDYGREDHLVLGEAELMKFVEKYRKNDGSPDVLIGFSGGRDSTFALEYIKNTLKMNPLTFIYDWGMVTDLARRNQARVCGKLGIEQIIVSADIKQKRGFIRKNLNAWLKKPDLGLVPILMAGDKEFYHYFHKIRKENGIKLFIFCGGYEGEESTGAFKLGFCGVDRGYTSATYRMTGISIINKIKLIAYYMKNYLTNPAYFNSSILDTLFAYYSSYVLPDDYLYFYKYIAWDENTIVSTIKENFNWEVEKDTIATWRTDDGTAALYNYIYMTMAGFTEFDTIRSFQIREGKLSREEAYNLIKEENKPRFSSLEWYAEAVDFDVNTAIDIINAAPKLYQQSALLNPSRRRLVVPTRKEL